MEILIIIIIIIALINSGSKKKTSPINSPKSNYPNNINKNTTRRDFPNIKERKYQESNTSKIKAYSTNNAYKEWTSEEDLELKKLFLQGWTVSDLAKKFGRTNGAISSRIKKLDIQKNQIQSPIVSKSYNFYCYHFTDPRNIPSIKKYGLLSWEQLLNRNIIHYPASNDLSRKLDKRYNLENYVRLTLNQNHPMARAAIYYGRVQSLVWLKIKPNVIDLPGTLFSNTNATSNEAIINEIKDTALTSRDEQAEILVKEKIDLSYIIFDIKSDLTYSNKNNKSNYYDIQH